MCQRAVDWGWPPNRLWTKESGPGAALRNGRANGMGAVSVWGLDPNRDGSGGRWDELAPQLPVMSWFRFRGFVVGRQSRCPCSLSLRSASAGDGPVLLP